MCKEISGVITTGKRPRILSHNPSSHSGAEAALGLMPENYLEWEWTEADSGESLTVRVAEGEDENWYKSAILAHFKRRVELEDYFLANDPTDAWRCWAACDCKRLTDEQAQELAMGMKSDGWRYQAARDCERLTDEQAQELAMGIKEDKWRYWAACDCKRLTDEQRRILGGVV